MIGGVWGRIDSLYDVHVDPVEYLVVDNDRVVVIGRYGGSARDGDTSVDAAFAHVSRRGTTAWRHCARSPTPPDGASRVDDGSVTTVGPAPHSGS